MAARAEASGIHRFPPLSALNHTTLGRGRPGRDPEMRHADTIRARASNCLSAKFQQVIRVRSTRANLAREIEISIMGQLVDWQ